ncbi:hypothetical protein CP985_04820 [Malaciobacter mytili LMG 24559]|uniref:Leucine-binding protein domain-containing protein n=1 Tax=Malaciobacter mytili LMG 24559 TaxID=1032238 RepID=A0AAX2AJ25_9BACT|nr:ABC transporter substrate-binding protein [Malaciobacter mytili]AXH15636.1 periplasmic ligand-binding domain-containing protein [Malaciobacter mytili LMG 24559]RXK16176.1 hypothetical protein CP985_04820 [Malaciobacter mytili LMG 24559]
MKKIAIFLIIFILFLILLFAILKKNSNEEIIKIGFISSLSGKYSSLGHSVLNGFKLAFEEIDYKIDKNKIELIIKDDKQEQSEDEKVVEELINENIKIIVGNTTSSMTKVSRDKLLSHPEILLISATASSNEFTNIDDNFIRTQVANNSKKFDTLSKYLIKNNIENISIIYDLKNSNYSKGVALHFEKSYKQYNGKVVSKLDLNLDFNEILKQINSDKINAVFIIANAIDTAKLAQFFKLNNFSKTLISSGWAKELKLIEEGGIAVEDMIFVTGYDDNSTDPKYLKFVKKYQKRYGDLPSVFSAQAYETASILIETLKKHRDTNEFKKIILSKKSYDGLQGKIIFDDFGDVYRDYFIMSIKNKKYKKID